VVTQFRVVRRHRPRTNNHTADTRRSAIRPLRLLCSIAETRVSERILPILKENNAPGVKLGGPLFTPLLSAKTHVRPPLKMCGLW
jgi:hypothetical protein